MYILGVLQVTISIKRLSPLKLKDGKKWKLDIQPNKIPPECQHNNPHHQVLQQPPAPLWTTQGC